MAELNDIRINGQHRLRGRASICRPAPRRYGCNDWRLAARLGLIGRHRRTACPPKITKTPRSPARPRTIRWHGRRIAGGLLYVVCHSGAEGEIGSEKSRVISPIQPSSLLNPIISSSLPDFSISAKLIASTSVAKSHVSYSGRSSSIIL